MVQSTPPFRATSIKDPGSELDDLPALLKELDDAAGVAHGVEDKLDTLIAQIEALEKSLESQLAGSGHESNTRDSDSLGGGQENGSGQCQSHVEGGIEPLRS